MKTAVEWFIEQIKKDSNLRLRGFDLDKIGEQAKELEKQQIINARLTAPQDLITISKTVYLDEAEQYYNEKFKSE